MTCDNNTTIPRMVHPVNQDFPIVQIHWTGCVC